MKTLLMIVAILTLGCIEIDPPKIVPHSSKKKHVDTIQRFRTKPIGVAEENRKISITSTIKSFKVSKRKQKLYAYFGDTVKVFRISLGGQPIGHKTKQGDLKTPEGLYKITFKNPKSRGYKSLKISYPNEADKANARQMGVNPGGDIFIHGLWWDNQDPKNHWKTNWTLGCIALSNQEIEEIFNYTEVNTPILILP
jgi:murein L,D-transpeptidase YafK